MGDTNCNLISNKDNNAKRLTSVCDQYYLKQQIKDCTCIVSERNGDG